MNTLVVVLLGALCCSSVMAGYGRSYYSTGYKTHLGGAHYGYRPIKYASHGLSHGLSYSKPIYRPAVYAPKPIIYAPKPIIYAAPKPIVSHYVKPAIHHAPIIYSKPAYSLGGHAYAHKPISHGYPIAYKSYHH